MSHETIRLGSTTDFVELRFVEAGPAATPAEGDIRLATTVHFNGFTGKDHEVWIARDDWASFLARLRQLERERTGQASLFSMSPEEFELHLQIVDQAGHLAAHGSLSRYNFGHPAGNATRSRIEYYMSVDPGLLRDLVVSFEDLGQPIV